MTSQGITFRKTLKQDILQYCKIHNIKIIHLHRLTFSKYIHGVINGETSEIINLGHYIDELEQLRRHNLSIFQRFWM